MEHEPLLRLALIVGFVAVFPVAFDHRLRSQATGEKLDRRQEGMFILLTLRPIAAVRMAALVAWVIDPKWVAWSAVDLPVWLRWIGVGFGAATGVLLIWTFRSLGKNLTDTVVTRREHALITTGPYRWVRHPLYLATLLAVITDSLMAANWFLAWTGVVVFALLVIRTRREEEELVKRFGDDYRRYMDSTPMFFPVRLSSVRKK